MTEETFRLTQIREKSRYALPALNSPISLTRHKSRDLPPSTEHTTGKLYRSSSTFARVSDKLSAVQQDVKRSFDNLYSTQRIKLLPKAMELERSDSVKDQLRSLETYVVSLLKSFNELQNQRRAKEVMLTNLSKELENVLDREPDLTPIKTTAEEVNRRYEFTQRQIEREEDYTEVLDHVILERSRSISSKVQPIYSLRRELQQFKLRFHESEVDYLRVSLEAKSTWNMIKRNEEALNQQKNHNGLRIQEKILHFRRRAEFVELVQRQDGQKALEAQIKDNERDTRRMEKAKSESEGIEQMLDASKTHLEALREYERQSDKLSRAAHTGSIQQVIDYWQYLQSFQVSLTGRVESGTARIAELREEFKTLCEERTTMRLSLGPIDSVSPEELTKLREMLAFKEKEIADRMNKVIPT